MSVANSGRKSITTGLAALHPGDTVMRTWGKEGLKLFEVASVTPKHIALCGSHQKWRVSDGGIVNGGVRPRLIHDCIRAYDDQTWFAYVRSVARQAHIADLAQFDWSTLDETTARKMHALLPHAS